MVATSGVLTGSTVVCTSKHKLMSISATTIADCSSSTFSVKIWDSNNSTTTGKVEMFRIQTKGNHSTGEGFNFEIDTHGAIAGSGLFVQIAGTGQVSITFE
tara:strand:+ start:2665 stop:2967 length:303 start_codon:yes stop_codon:yes gene_type:complete